MGSIAEKLSYLNGTKRLLRRRLNSLGANITLDTTFRDYLVWLDRFYSAASSPIEFEILGETTQRATNTSINLIPINDGQIVTDGITVVLSEGGKISVNGTATRDVWIKITNGIEAIYEDPMSNDGHTYYDTYGWLKEKIEEFNSETTLYIQDCWGTGTAPSGGYPTMVVVTKRTSGYDFRTNPIENLVINTASRHDKDIYATTTKDNTLEINCVYLYFPQGSVVNQYFWVQACLTSQTKWQPNYDALPPSPDNPKWFWSPDDIRYTASDGTEFPLYLSYPDAPYDFILGGIGDYKDRIYYKNGKFYCERNIGRVVLNGSENDFYALNGVYYTNGNYMSFKNNSSVVSNYYVYGGGATNTSSAYNNGNNKISLNYSDGKSFYLRNDSLNTKSAWSTWLSTHNTELYYVPNEPLITEITEQNAKTLYDQLKAIIDHETKLEIEKKIF